MGAIDCELEERESVDVDVVEFEQEEVLVGREEGDVGGEAEVETCSFAMVLVKSGKRLKCKAGKILLINLIRICGFGRRNRFLRTGASDLGNRQTEDLLSD